MQIPEKYVIEAYRLLGFSVRPDPNPKHLVCVADDGWLFFHEILEDSMMELEFIVQDIESTEGTMGMQIGWARNVWLPALAEVLKGTDYKLPDED